jgi:hypothetical protein
MGDETHDVLAISCRQPLPGVRKASAGRSIQKRPSGLSITSTTAGSSGQAVIAIAVRSIRTLREADSDLGETIPTRAPFLATAQDDRMSGTIKKTQDRLSATTRIGA